MTNKLPIIEILDLHKSYDKLDVLKGVDLVAHEGCVVSLIGASGSGKSTLLRCANLLENSQHGDVIFNGDKVKWAGEGSARHPSDKQQLRRIRSQLSMVFQQFNLWSHMTILQNISEAPVTVLQESADEVEARARALLKKVGILDKADVPTIVCTTTTCWDCPCACHESESHSVRRANIRADPEMEQEVLQVIKALVDEGRTMILVTHDMNLAYDISDHVVFLHEGRILEEGSPQTMFKTPKSDRLRQFLKSTKITSK